MSDPDLAPQESLPAGWLVRQRRVLIAWAVVGAIIGGLWGFLGPVDHTAEARLLVGTFEAPSAAIPGYVLASQTIAANYARLAQSAAVTTKLDERLGSDQASSGVSVSVTAIPESAIIRVEATSGDAGKAQRVADAMAQALTDAVGELNAANSGEDLLRQYEEAARELATATTAQEAAQAALAAAPAGSAKDAAQAALDQASLAVSTAQLKVDGLATQYTTQQQTLSTSAQVRVLGDATVRDESRLVHTGVSVVIGALLGAVVGLVVAVWRGRRSRRPERESETAGGVDAVVTEAGART